MVGNCEGIPDGAAVGIGVSSGMIIGVGRDVGTPVASGDRVGAVVFAEGPRVSPSIVGMIVGASVGPLVGLLEGASVGRAVRVVGGKVSGVGAAELVGTLDGASDCRTVVGAAEGGTVVSTICSHVANSAKASHSTVHVPPVKHSPVAVSLPTRPEPGAPPTAES